jgi:diguanylate cyclase (GGDEF)-like protein/putative nucleotidyltransferase with HDIG domain
MGTGARIYIGAILAGGVVCFAHAMAGWNCRHPLQYLCLLAVALPASTLKVFLPGVAGTISVSYVFVLLGMLEFSYAETVLLACLAMFAQCWWRTIPRPKMLRVAFNLASTAIAVSLGFVTYHAVAGRGEVLVGMAAATTVYFLASTVSIAAVVALTESKNLPEVWRECYLWSFPYYLAGGAIATLISICNHRLGWQTAVLALPVVYVILRSYRLYVGRLDTEKNHAEEMANLHLRTIEALALAVEAKDHTTHEHLLRVQTYAMELGKKVHLDGNQLQALRTASILHDIGKLAVPEHIISKPGRLTAEEFEKMKIHPVVGAEILDRVQFPFEVVPIVRAHHERWNGTGYPYGLKGEEIPLGARILAVADCLDALSSDRQYRRALPLDAAMAMVVAESGKSYEPRLVKILQENYREWASLARSREPQGSRLSKNATIAGGTPAAGLQTCAAADPEQPDVLFSAAAAWQEAQALYELTEQPGNSLNLHETLAVLDSRLRGLIPYDAIAVYVRQGDRLVPRYVSGENMRLFSALRIPVGQGLSGWVAASGKPLINGNPSVEPGYLNDPSKFSTLRSALAIPLENAAGVTGVLALYHLGSDAFNQDHLRVLLALKPKLSLIVENALERARAAVSATTDPLTSLPDARALFRHLEEELARCRRTGTELAVLVGDLDGFRQVNDRFGYLEGNRVLKLVAAGLDECSRQCDYVARMGGDEFALVLPDFQIEHLSKTLLALERVAAESGLAVCGERLIDISVGAVFYPDNGIDTEGLLAEAERRMYLAKRRLKMAAPSDSSGLANLAVRIEDSAVCTPHSALLQ